MPLAEPERRRERRDRRGRRARQPPCGLEHPPIGRGAVEPVAQRGEQLERILAGALAGLAARAAPEILQRDAPVAQLVGRDAEHRAGGARAQAHSRDDLARRDRNRDRSGVGAGDDGASGAHHHVEAAVGEDERLASRARAHPHAAHHVSEFRRRGELAVGHEHIVAQLSRAGLRP